MAIHLEHLPPANVVLDVGKAIGYAGQAPSEIKCFATKRVSRAL